MSHYVNRKVPLRAMLISFPQIMPMRHPNYPIQDNYYSIENYGQPVGLEAGTYHLQDVSSL